MNRISTHRHSPPRCATTTCGPRPLRNARRFAALGVASAGAAMSAHSPWATAGDDGTQPTPVEATADTTTIPAVSDHGVTPEHGAIKIGMSAPDFQLPDVDGKLRRLSDFAGKGQIVVLQWYNPTCRYIVKYHETHPTMRDLYERFGPDEGVLWVAVNSGSVESGTADPTLNKARAAVQGVEYPILLDSEGAVGRLYGAKVTPQFFLLDGDGVVRWVGPVDNEPSDRWLGRRQLLGDAIAALSSGTMPNTSNVAPFGCAVKYANSQDLEVTP